MRISKGLGIRERKQERERGGAIPESQGALKDMTMQYPEVSKVGLTWLLGDLQTDSFYTRKTNYADAITKAKQPI